MPQESSLDVLDRITALAEGICKGKGLDLVDCELFRAGRRRIVRVYIGKAPSVSVEDCADVSRELAVLLDAEDVLGQDMYTLEVSSPGLDRPFKTPRDWQRNVGRTIKVSLKEPIEGKHQVIGILKTLDGDVAVLTPKSPKDKPVTIPLNLVAQARCEVTFGVA